MTVDAEGDFLIGVPEAFGNDSYRHAAGEQFTRVRVPKGMQAHAGETDLAHEFHDAGADPVRRVIRAIGLTEHQGVLLVVGGEEFAIAVLSRCMLLDTKGCTMAIPLSVMKFETKSHSSPDEVRKPAKTRVEIVRLGNYTLGRFILEPGWRWSECVKPVVKTDTCQIPHVGYVVSGRITVRLNDGTQKTIGTGESYAIPAGHDAWVEGNEPFVAIEMMSADIYARPA